jgi:hypothetical protein
MQGDTVGHAPAGAPRRTLAYVPKSVRAPIRFFLFAADIVVGFIRLSISRCGRHRMYSFGASVLVPSQRCRLCRSDPQARSNHSMRPNSRA